MKKVAIIAASVQLVWMTAACWPSHIDEVDAQIIETEEEAAHAADIQAEETSEPSVDDGDQVDEDQSILLAGSIDVSDSVGDGTSWGDIENCSIVIEDGNRFTASMRLATAVPEIVEFDQEASESGKIEYEFAFYFDTDGKLDDSCGILGSEFSIFVASVKREGDEPHSAAPEEQFFPQVNVSRGDCSSDYFAQSASERPQLTIDEDTVTLAGTLPEQVDPSIAKLGCWTIITVDGHRSSDMASDDNDYQLAGEDD